MKSEIPEDISWDHLKEVATFYEFSGYGMNLSLKLLREDNDRLRAEVDTLRAENAWLRTQIKTFSDLWDATREARLLIERAQGVTE